MQQQQQQQAVQQQQQAVQQQQSAQHAPMSAAQHTQRSAWQPGHWQQGYSAGQAYAPGSMPQQGAYASPPPGYAGHAHPNAAPATVVAGGGIPPQAQQTQPMQGQVPAYPVHAIGSPPPQPAPSSYEFNEPAKFNETAVHHPVEEEVREPTPPLFKTIPDGKTMVPSSTRGGTMPPAPGTIPPPTQPPPPEIEEPPPQSTTSPNTPLPDPSPSPPASEVTPPARSGDDLADGIEDGRRNKRGFVEDGKTTQLSFTSAAHPFAMSVEQYAGLCAERDLCDGDTERVRKIHKRYEIGDQRARSLVDRLFKLRFDAEPELETTWREQYARFKARIHEANADKDS